MHAFSRHAVFAIAAFAFVAAAVVAMACAGPAAEPATPQPAAPATAVPAATSAAAATETAVPPPPTDAPASPTQAPAEATTAPSATDTPVPPTPTAENLPYSAVHTFTLGEGTVARYKVEEVLANTGFKVATGETTAVSGQVVMGEDSIVAADSSLSSIVVQAATLRTDSNRRDGYVRNRTLETDTYPEIVFRPTSVDGLPQLSSRPSGAVEFTVTGDLTVRDQTREVTWEATADFSEFLDGDVVTGSASVEFTFDDFGMDKPRVAIVVSVEDTIRLELDFVATVSVYAH